MRINDAQLGKPEILYKDTQANIEALADVDEGAVAYATDTNQLGTYDGSAWNWGSGSGGAGDVAGPGSSTDNAITRFDSTTGKVIQNSLAAVDDSGGINIPTGQTYNINGSPHTHASAAAPDYICIRDKKAQNTPGGTFTAGAWRTRDLNDEQSDTGNHASIASNQITLAAGTYIIDASAPAYQVARHQIKLYNVTAAADILFGSTHYCSATSGTDDVTRLRGKFTLSVQSVLEIRHQCQVTSADTNGMGIAANFGEEIYTVVELWKVG